MGRMRIDDKEVTDEDDERRFEEQLDAIQDGDWPEHPLARLSRRIRRTWLPVFPVPADQRCRDCPHHSNSHSFVSPRPCQWIGCECKGYVSNVEVYDLSGWGK